MKHFAIYFLLIIAFTSNAQLNLVSNSSFEDTVACNVAMTITNPMSPNYYLKYWETASGGGSPDYMNICANSYTQTPYPWVSSVPKSRYGFQYPRTGNAYAAMSTYLIYSPSDSSKNFVECFSIKLNDTLSANKCYYGEFYASLADICEISTNQLSMLLTNTPFFNAMGSFTNTIQPQVQWDTTKYFKDTANWVKIGGSFVAQGGEQYLTIGNFKDGLHTKKTGVVSNFTPPIAGTPNNFMFVFIDDVSLYELPNHNGTKTYTICAGNSLVLGDSANLPVRYQWSTGGIVIDTNRSITVNPTNTTTYILQTQHCSSQTQTITVVVDTNCNPLPAGEPQMPNVFTPNEDGKNDAFFINLPVGYRITDFAIYNRWGNVIYQSEQKQKNIMFWDGHTTSGEKCSEGVYYYLLQYIDAKGEKQHKNGYISLFR